MISYTMQAKNRGTETTHFLRSFNWSNRQYQLVPDTEPAFDDMGQLTTISFEGGEHSAIHVKYHPDHVSVLAVVDGDSVQALEIGAKTEAR